MEGKAILNPRGILIVDIGGTVIFVEDETSYPDEADVARKGRITSEINGTTEIFSLRAMEDRNFDFSGDHIIGRLEHFPGVTLNSYLSDALAVKENVG